MVRLCSPRLATLRWRVVMASRTPASARRSAVHVSVYPIACGTPAPARLAQARHRGHRLHSRKRGHHHRVLEGNRLSDVLDFASMRRLPLYTATLQVRRT
jgi:hypothetical protein